MQCNAKLGVASLVVCTCWIILTYLNYGEVVSNCPLPNSGHRTHKVLIPRTNTSEIQAPNIAEIGLAFIILVHNLKTIKTALATIEILQHPRNYFVVHVDRKVGEADLGVLTNMVTERGFQNVKVIATQSIVWGGRELLPAALDGITEALEWPDWHYMFLMSGDCLPIKSLPDIQAKMANFWPKNSLSIHNQGIFERSEVGKIKQLRFRLKDGQKFDDLVKGLQAVYYGTTWVTLTRPFVAWTLRDSFSRNFLLYLTAAHIDLDPETGYPSIFEESYYQTIIMHSPFKDTLAGANDGIRFEKWSTCNYVHEDRAVPCALGEKDVSEFNATDCIFARKFVYSELPSFIKSQLTKYDKLLS